MFLLTQGIKSINLVKLFNLGKLKERKTFLNTSIPIIIN